MRDRNEPGDLRFGPCVIEDVESWKYLLSGNGKLSSPGAAGHRRWPDGQLSLCVGSMNTRQSPTSWLGRGFHTVRDCIDSGDLRIFPGFLKL